VRVLGEESLGREGVGVVKMSELVRERECGLNGVEPKNGWPRFNRSDRLLRPVRPVPPRLTGVVLICCFVA